MSFLANIKRQVEHQQAPRNKVGASEYQVAKSKAMDASTAGMTAEEKAAYKEKQMAAFDQLQTTVQSNDVDGLEALISQKILHSIDYHVAWSLCADHPQCAAVASVLAQQF